MRAVHDILFSLEPGSAPGPCAFIQHGKEEEGFEYECVCPWCAQSVGDRIASESLAPFTYAKLLSVLKRLMKAHMPFCTGDGRTQRVHATKVPLGTDEKPRVM